MNRRLLLLLFAVPCTPLGVFAQSLAPRSFEVQIRQNAKNLISNWSLVREYQGQWRKLQVLHAEIEAIDVVKSESLLYPFVGKVSILIGLEYGQLVETKEEAEGQRRDPKRAPDPMEINVVSFDLQFVPGDTAWRFLSGLSRSSASAMIGGNQWIPLTPIMLRSGPYGAIINALSTPVAAAKLKPKLKQGKAQLQM